MFDSGRKMRVLSRTVVISKGVLRRCFRISLPSDISDFAYQGASLIDRQLNIRPVVASPMCRHQHNTNTLVRIFAYSLTSDNAFN
jgi:hypothetical protein